MSRLTRNQDKFWGKGNYKGNKYIIGCDGVTSKQMIIDKLGKLEDLMEKYEIESVEALEEIIKDYDDMAKSIVEMGLGVKVEIKDKSE